MIDPNDYTYDRLMDLFFKEIGFVFESFKDWSYIPYVLVSHFDMKGYVLFDFDSFTFECFENIHLAEARIFELASSYSYKYEHFDFELKGLILYQETSPFFLENGDVFYP